MQKLFPTLLSPASTVSTSSPKAHMTAQICTAPQAGRRISKQRPPLPLPYLPALLSAALLLRPRLSRGRPSDPGCQTSPALGSRSRGDSRLGLSEPPRLFMSGPKKLYTCLQYDRLGLSEPPCRPSDQRQSLSRVTVPLASPLPLDPAARAARRCRATLQAPDPQTPRLRRLRPCLPVAASCASRRHGGHGPARHRRLALG